MLTPLRSATSRPSILKSLVRTQPRMWRRVTTSITIGLITGTILFFLLRIRASERGLVRRGVLQEYELLS